MSDFVLNTWNISQLQFPTSASDSEILRFLLNYAVLAPSGHNTQPWLFQINGNILEFYADKSRALPIVDPENRALIISCGAALLNLRIAMRHFNYAGKIETFPKHKAPDLLARISLGENKQATVQEHLLFEAIPKRHTNRKQFENRQLPESLLSEFQLTAREEKCWLHIVQSEDEKKIIADLIAEGDSLQWSNKQFRRELAKWIRDRHSSTHDGIPAYALGMLDVPVVDLISLVGAFAMRTFDMGNTQASKDYQLALHSPILLVLGTENDTPQAWLSAGQALGKILLQARAQEIWASFLNQAIEVPQLRFQLRETLGKTGFPQLLFRIGYGSPVKATPRRMVSEVLCES
jgi:hypothetical protein